MLWSAALAPMDELRGVLRAHFARYPAMTPQDAVKLIYQNEFGAGHLVTDKRESLARLLEEWEALTPAPDAPLLEEIGNGLCRVNLAAAAGNGVPPSILNRLFVLGAEGGRGDRTVFLRKLEVLRGAGEAAPFSRDGLKEYLRGYEAAGYPAVRHSEVYQAACRPAYRVLPKRFAAYLPLFAAVYRLLEEQENVVIALDGMAAAGKTTLAGLLEAVFDCAAVPMDDFFLPQELRTPQRLAQQGGNVHYEQFAAEVTPHLGSGLPFAYSPFDCGSMRYAPAVVVPARRLTVVEGSYSVHPGLGAAYDLRAFLTVSPEEQAARILRRNGPELARRFLEEWIPMENAYREAFWIPARCDLVF